LMARLHQELDRLRGRAPGLGGFLAGGGRVRAIAAALRPSFYLGEGPRRKMGAPLRGRPGREKGPRTPGRGRGPGATPPLPAGDTPKKRWSNPLTPPAPIPSHKPITRNRKRKDPLVDVPAKSVLVQFAEGDQDVTSPRTTALLRAGDLADRATLYRHDPAFAEGPTLPRNPHQFLIMVDVPAVRPLALVYQAQIATF